MSKLIEFLKSLLHKSAEAIAKDRAAILKTFQDTIDDLKKNGEAAIAAAVKHEADIVKAQAKILAANVKKEALAIEQKATEAIVAKFQSLIS